jgi:peptide/nickel transport system permease protein
MENLGSIIFKRLGLGFLTIFVISVLIFIGVEALPGDVAQAVLGQDATPETIAAFRKEMKLDMPPHTRYISWLKGMVTGDMGNSLASSRPVTEMVGWRFSNTLFLASAAAVVAIPISLFLGILAALYRNTLFDKTISMMTLSAISFPEFFIAYILLALFAVKIHLFPTISNIHEDMTLGQKIYAVILPSITLTLVVAAHMMRQTRAAIINVLASALYETLPL